MREQGDKVLGDDKDAVESALADLKSALAGTEVEPIKTATERLMSASQTFTQKLYEQASAENAGQYDAGDGSGGAAGASSATTTSSMPRSSTRTRTSR